MERGICFVCESEVYVGKPCEVCGYEYSLEISKCPRLLNEGVVCSNTKKFCKIKNYLECSILHREE